MGKQGHSSYECKVNIYVKPPHADAPVGVVISLLFSPKYDFDVGHTSWMMEVVPRSAKNHIKSFCTRSDAKHLNVCVGYCPLFVEYSGNCPWKLYKQISR